MGPEYCKGGLDTNEKFHFILCEFLLTCINQNWKIPIAYYFIKGINAEEKKNLLLNCISAVHQYNIKVVAVTFDGLKTNFRMACLLGANFNINSFQTWFHLPNTSDKIFIFLDPSHLIKIIRNVFEKKGMMNAMDNIISWQYIKELHLLQEQEGLHIANKLRSIHVNFFKQKMKVRLAAQTLSKSVTDAMQFCNTLKLPQFEGCDATIYFIHIMYAKLNECFKYICNLKESRHGKLLINSPKKAGFLGFCISIKSLMGLYDMLCEEPNSSLQYIIQINNIALYCDKNSQIITRFSRSIVSYIAGFVVHFLTKKINCTQCVEALTELQPNFDHHDLISIKNKGGLLYPSKDVIFICEICEKCIRLAIMESNSPVLPPKYNVHFFLTKILSYFIENHTIFSKLNKHTLEQIGIDNHIIHLIRAIATKI
ncbi:THAP domain-containing protein 9 [Cyphomyrmex costatus]|uniref:THAP domain-containing protein 9 n=1 Tax=Cyphomyrmex costatus TaxID=456900 RepID=A0A151IGR1_9HYME|nr:THAP domain-containing protein 9 [Cyphomyrmex costatus]